MGITKKKKALGANASTRRRSLPITTNNNNIRLIIRGRRFARRPTTTPAAPALDIPRRPRTTATFILVLVSTALRRARLLEEEVSALRAGSALRSGVLAARIAWGRRPGGAAGVVARRVRE